MKISSSQFTLLLFVVLIVTSPIAKADKAEDLRQMWNELKKPLDPEVPDAYRPNYAKVAEAFALAIRENPKLLNFELRRELFELLSSKDARFTAAQNDLNKFLPPNLVKAFDKKVTQSRLHPSNTDPCKVMCRVAENLSEKISNSLHVKPDAYLATLNSKSSFSLAVRSLMGEFLLKAKMGGCDLQEIESKVSAIVNEASDFAKADAYQPITKGATREALKTVKGSRDAIRKALAFVDRVENLDENGLPTNGATLYFYLQAKRSSDALRNSSYAGDTEALKALDEKIEEHLNKVVDARSSLFEGDGGSLITTYALAAIGASMPKDSQIQKRIAEILSDVRMEFRKTGGSGFPYNLNPEILKQSERGGAARSVVAQLAIYKGGSPEQKLANADELLSALFNYDKHFRDIFSGIGLNRTHDRQDNDQLAPYYGPATIPYVFEALSLLGKEKGLTREQSKKLMMLRDNLQKKLLGMFEPDGLFQPQNSNYYSSAPLYDNALTGLALAEACRAQREVKASLSLKEGFKFRARQRQKRNHSRISPSLGVPDLSSN
ncbi:MAG: hypothetical protein ACKN9V_07115 [Pseudomonadota bacterium]